MAGGEVFGPAQPLRASEYAKLLAGIERRIEASFSAFLGGRAVEGFTAEDVAQAVLARAWQEKRWQEKRVSPALLYYRAKKRALDLVRKSRRRRAAHREIPAPRLDAAQSWDANELADELRRTREMLESSLHPEHLRIVEMHYGGGLSVAAIAEKVDSSPRTVHRRLKESCDLLSASGIADAPAMLRRTCERTVHEGGSLGSFLGWTDDLTENETRLRDYVGRVVSGETAPDPAARLLFFLEHSPSFREFFEDARHYARAEEDSEERRHLAARLSTIVGDPELDGSGVAEGGGLARRLATVLFAVGKSYVVAALEPDDFRERLFEAARPVVDPERDLRRVVDRAMAATESAPASVREQCHELISRLEHAGDALARGRELIEYARAVDPTHEEARIYSAFLYVRDGQRAKGIALYKSVLADARKLANRGHAAIQLGRIESSRGRWLEAVKYWRWVTYSGLADAEGKFWPARFNLGLAFAHLEDPERSLGYFRALVCAHSDHVEEAARAFAAPEAQEAIGRHPGLVDGLRRHCPELFGTPKAATLPVPS